VEVVLGGDHVQSPESKASESTEPGPQHAPTTGGHPPLIKTLRAGEGFLAQSSKWLHFGLGAADLIDKVTVHWPGGEVEQFTDMNVDHRYRLIQGSGTAQDITLPARKTKLVRSIQKVSPPSQIARVRMVELPVVPKSRYVGFDGRRRILPTKTGNLLLVNLWASWCKPCLTELGEFSRRYDELQAKGIKILALSVDGLGEDASAKANAVSLVSKRKFPFPVGQATLEMTADFQALHDLQMPLHRQLPLPSSFLIDRQGRLAVIYKGPVSVDELLEDVAHSKGNRLERFARSAPIAGQPILHPQVEQAAVNSAEVLRFRLARSLLQSGRADQAVRQYADMLKLNPESFRAHIELGNLLQQQGKLVEAIAHYQQALQIKPDNAETHNNLGTALQGQGKIAKAIAHYQRAVEIDPEDAEAYYNLGTALHGQGKFATAIEYYQRAVEINPEDTATHTNLGIALQGQGKIAEAIVHYQRAVEINPDDGRAHANLGLALQSQGKITEAVVHYQLAVRINPDDAITHNNLGTALHGQGKTAEAIAHYQQALRINPNYTDARTNLGNAVRVQ
jgi:tetratricopeptide (TPR) repeat protein